MAYRICSISGGGVRGIIPTTIIKEMLTISKSNGGAGKITDICDYVVGTSVGGIVGGGLVVKDGVNTKFTPNQILELLQSNAEAIFPQPSTLWNSLTKGVVTTVGGAIGAGIGFLLGGCIGGFSSNYIDSVGIAKKRDYNVPHEAMKDIASEAGRVTGIVSGGLSGAVVGYLTAKAYLEGCFSPQYSRNGIDNLLKEYFEDLKLTDTVIPFTTVSYSLEEQNPRIWSTFKANKVGSENFFLRDALGATSAAPTFFPHKATKTESGKLLYDIDGGIFANSPVNLAIAVLMKHAPDEVISKIEKEGIKVLSIGTGYHKNTEPSFIPPTSFEEGKLGYGLKDPLVFKVMEATEKDSIIQARHVHKALRLDPKLDGSLMPMDKSNPEHIKNLSKAANDFVIEHQEIVKGYAKCMIEDINCKELITESTPDYSYEEF